jgi:hypothetical protein
MTGINRRRFGFNNRDGCVPTPGTRPRVRVASPGCFFSAPPCPPPPDCPDAGSEEEIMSKSTDEAKLAKLIEIEGYESVETLLQAVIGDSVSPAICMNDGCNYTCEMEPDQRRGWCDECRTNTMKAAPVLAGII